MPARVLVVDDDLLLRRLLQGRLVAAGYAVTAVGTARAAREHLAREAVDAVVLDRQLGGDDGLEVCRWLRERGDRVPVLLLTGSLGETAREIALAAGADDYLPKPVDLPELLEHLGALLARSAEDPAAPP